MIDEEWKLNIITLLFKILGCSDILIELKIFPNQYYFEVLNFTDILYQLLILFYTHISMFKLLTSCLQRLLKNKPHHITVLLNRLKKLFKNQNKHSLNF